MSRTNRWISGSILLGIFIYAIAPNAFGAFSDSGFWSWRHDIVLLSGTISFVLMTLVVLISTRNPMLERLTGGLDKGYIIHKWAGIWAVSTGTLHWLVEKTPKWTYSLGIWPEKVKGGHAAQPDWQVTLWKSGNVAAEYMIYAAIILAIVALSNRIPYRYFRFTHKAFAVAYLVFAWHSATIMLKTDWFATPSGYIVLALALAGSIAVLQGLLGFIGLSRRAEAVVTAFRDHGGVLDIRLGATSGYAMAHNPGQFAFLRFDHDPEPHPFSFASSGKDATNFRFGIKALGDYTTKLAEKISVGQTVKLEGPYGGFHFDHATTQQVWIAGGIGITPFLARLEHLAANGGTDRPVDLWYCAATAENAKWPADLRSLCEETGVTLQVMVAERQEFLNARTVAETTGTVDDVSVLFCGPQGFAGNILDGLKARGFAERNFHYDAFGMR
ncbi:ferric reductase-like transmembrane domain-containing protein [Rhodomicrobium sp. Az07]|uniref:ferredoxin reductase family protein n=1 Tax=Rhodomicrobium sp. Az07 TaxID=2839034 RepID=UPI001BE53F36|nr:ferric reductase-like transmembrane domain-containing protein [Rhodomicrobium sp. Az07]MBT3071130.1 ferric reductase-like transmembrane domain-containing protein [Rhodomicrobium sp. Az07]